MHGSENAESKPISTREPKEVVQELGVLSLCVRGHVAKIDRLLLTSPALAHLPWPLAPAHLYMVADVSIEGQQGPGGAPQLLALHVPRENDCTGRQQRIQAVFLPVFCANPAIGSFNPRFPILNRLIILEEHVTAPKGHHFGEPRKREGLPKCSKREAG